MLRFRNVIQTVRSGADNLASASSEELNGQAEQLQQAVAYFKLT